jgi:uncharacterized protein (DUF362 family)/Pyruvate/2-oxoacid:ferredoxin oxidoreductase delta subunit
MQRVMICKATYEDCRQAVDRAFELFPLDLAGKKVVIKPNVLRTSSAEEHIVTNPRILRAVIEKVEEMSPAKITVGDNPGLFNYGDNENSFISTGLMEAAKGYYKNLGNSLQYCPFDPDFMAEVGVSQEIMEADILISLPKFKTHGLTVMTGAIKNSYGILPGAQKAKLHQIAGSPERFHEVIVQVFRLRVPDLFIMDAVVGMEGNGPASPELRDIGLVLASDNAVAMDAVVAQMMGLDPSRLGFLRKAKAEGLGDFAPDTIAIDGELQVLPNFKLPPLGGEAIVGNQAIRDLMNARAQVRPQADPARCTACGSCIDHCPVSALTLQEDLPRVDPEVCIACFCCQEICPEKAMTLK